MKITPKHMKEASENGYNVIVIVNGEYYDFDSSGYYVSEGDMHKLLKEFVDNKREYNKMLLEDSTEIDDIYRNIAKAITEEDYEKISQYEYLNAWIPTTQKFLYASGFNNADLTYFENEGVK